MPHKLIIKPEAELELVEVLEWYEEQLAGLGSRLFQEFNEVFDEITTNPEYFQKKYRNIRIRYTYKFNYGVHYTVEKDTVYVHAILHTSRKPRK
ncbi:type II toxin-antitoxin system RelE/ParE family toxin [Flavivirga aquimarina]|uniref:Type II toxin-antitoxin system RelE/ParE family toxin n=1 Tax=Flavivirga aquimarina TaxID=2027862 RepID=A0ABT8W6H7_9FLAO|nr:type II toxin-antitoxin system RelE/ParE family toxin [Flavivirga aquimarina]MDO5968667.1 type II toxin-antitoxin system RelE/ParE family toxin [Flavivirga aquimarina]